MKLSEEEKQKLFAAREVKDPVLNRVLNNSIKLLMSSDLGKKVLAGANYKDAISQSAYAEAKKNHTFAVEKAYVGIAGKVKGGHCGLISALDGDKTYENARGEVYINSNFVQDTVDALGEQRASVYLVNIVTHEFLHANQRTHMKTEPEDSRSRPKNEPFRKNTMTFEESVLAESAAMAGGLMLLTSFPLDDKLKSHTLKDFEKLGNLGADQYASLTSFVNAPPVDLADKQAAARKMMTIFIEGQTQYYAQSEGIKVDFSQNPDAVKAVYQKDIFGNAQDFVNAVPGLSDQSKKSIVKALTDRENKPQGLMQKLTHASNDKNGVSRVVQTGLMKNKGKGL